MSFKKNSPGCICCSRGVMTAIVEEGVFWRLPQEGGPWGIVSPFGAGTVVVGIDIERAYILYRRSNGEIWMYNPATGGVVDKLWESTSYISDPGIVKSAITYMHSWSKAYGLIGRSTSTSNYEAVSLDANGDIINGPYVNLNSPHLRYLTMLENGDIYMLSRTTGGVGGGAGPIGKLALFKNEDMEDTASGAGSATIVVSDPQGDRPPTSLFSDGTILYISAFISVLGSGPTNIFSVDNPSGNATSVIDTTDIFEGSRAPTTIKYNPLKDRYHGIVPPGSLEIATFEWFKLEENNHLPHFQSFDGTPNAGEQYIAYGTPLLEEVWNAMQT